VTAHEIRSLAVADWAVWREIRLRSLADAPEAFGSVGGMHHSPGTAELISMWVAPEARGTGVGRALVEAVVDWATSERSERVVLAVRRNNAPAVALYARSGFVLVGPNPDDADEDLMARDLQAAEVSPR